MSDLEPLVPACPDCGTALIRARLYSPFSSPSQRGEQLPLLVWRCESCGHAEPQLTRVAIIDGVQPKGCAYVLH